MAAFPALDRIVLGCYLGRTGGRDAQDENTLKLGANVFQPS